VNSQKLRCIASVQHLWESLAEVGCLQVISDFPDFLVVPNAADASVGLMGVPGPSERVSPHAPPGLKACVRVTQEPR
jgi:hypothetical protein